MKASLPQAPRGFELSGYRHDSALQESHQRKNINIYNQQMHVIWHHAPSQNISATLPRCMLKNLAEPASQRRILLEPGKSLVRCHGYQKNVFAIVQLKVESDLSPSGKLGFGLLIGHHAAGGDKPRPYISRRNRALRHFSDGNL